MNVKTLIKILQNMSPDAEIRMIQQPSHPMCYDMEDPVECEDSDGNPIVCFGEGEQTGYASSEMLVEMGWR